MVCLACDDVLRAGNGSLRWLNAAHLQNGNLHRKQKPQVVRRRWESDGIWLHQLHLIKLYLTVIKPNETWVCLKIGYIPNYSHLMGIMISKTIGFRGTLFSDIPTLFRDVLSTLTNTNPLSASPHPKPMWRQRRTPSTPVSNMCKRFWILSSP